LIDFCENNNAFGAEDESKRLIEVSSSNRVF